MNASATTDPATMPPAPPPSSRLSRLVRRIHMFTGLFLAPWMVMYALSTMVMTHHETVNSYYSSKAPAFVTERTLDYSRSFPTNLARQEIAQQVLRDLGLEGVHSVSGGRNGTPLVITRNHPLAARRVTLDAGAQTVLIQREEFRTPTILERLHRRRGYTPYALENTWGFTVDVSVVMMVFWSLSGIWLWWEIRPTRLWGAVSLLLGLSLFAVFAALI